MKLIKEYFLSVLAVSFLFNVCSAQEKPKTIAIDGYKGTAHHAFKVAESFLLARTNEKILSAVDCANTLNDSFLQSLHCCDGVELDGKAYALTCGDICADDVWLDQDETRRPQLKSIASRIVYIRPNIANQDFILTFDSEFKKILHQYTLLKQEKDYCFALVVDYSLMELGGLNVIFIDKKDGKIQTSIVGIHDEKIIKYLLDGYINGNYLKKNIIKSLEQFYSHAFSVACCKQLGISIDQNTRFDFSFIAAAYEALDNIKHVGLHCLSIVQKRYARL